MSNDRTAELLAAVRAVESGERSADSFFTEPAPPARRPRPADREAAPQRTAAPAPAGPPPARGAAAP
nr:hypothetical protein [Streptomyces albus]